MFPPPPTASLPALENRVPLHLATTMRLGGDADWVARPKNADAAITVIRAARRASMRISILGGGSNVVVADAGIRGVTICPEMKQVTAEEISGRVLLTLGAGVSWKDAIDASLTLESAGLAMLAGIPGSVGASPIQNIGAYGAEVSDSLFDVDLICIKRGRVLRLPRAALGLAYRSSHFKKAWRGKYLITQARFLLGAKNSREFVRHREIQAELGGVAEERPSLVAQAVLRVRRRKSMVLDANDPNSRGCGSFFANPIVSAQEGRRLTEKWPKLPAWDEKGGLKLSAAWLIEQAGFEKGWSDGPVGLSTRHTLALINRGNARAADIIGAALKLRRAVLEKFGVVLIPEAIGMGEFSQSSHARQLWTSLIPTAGA